MDHDDLKRWSERAADWLHGYHKSLRARPVRARTAPGEVARALPEAPPEAPEPMARIFADFEAIVPDAMTHWQHPRFFAYFPANAAPASMLAEQLANGIAAQAMLWQTSPAATEIEQVMIAWLRRALGLPERFSGTIHDSATTATLSAVLTMRERALGWAGNAEGLSGQGRLRIYCSDQAHSSIRKAARIAGLGDAGICTIPTDDTLSIRPDALESAIEQDKSNNIRPAGVILVSGGTSVGAFDRLAGAIAVARRHDLHVHVDAAWAGSAMICPEFRPLWEGVEGADSIVFNPHKWLGAQFDCAVQFLAEPEAQLRTLALRPDYLQTLERGEEGRAGPALPPDFNEWTVPLGRRFRALKLWFVLRAYGLSGLRARIRNHVRWAGELAERIRALPGFRIVTEPRLSLFTFAFRDDAATEALLRRINDDGRIYLTQTRHEGRFVIRLQVGQFDTTREDVMMVEQVLRDISKDIS